MDKLLVGFFITLITAFIGAGSWAMAWVIWGN